jgi:multiple sugar transport system ATP-binding protein
MAEIRLSGVNKVYPDGTHAVHDVDLQIADGEFMIMVGPSGCAKSTILRMIAGLETPTSGTVEIGGRVVNDVAPKDRDIAMVFQSYALYPHMTVRENMAFGLKLRRMPQGEIDQRVADAARILGLEQLLDRLPKAMSGGQRQRVAMGRAIVREPQAFLMDEPLSNLDAKLRVQMRTEIAKLHQRLRTTTVYVTHDQVEAMTLGQRICILRKGLVQQVDTPFQVYQNPANVFVGGFIGSPGMNFMDGHLLLHEGMVYLQLGDRHLPLPASVSSRLPSAIDLHGRGVIVGIRPEHLSMTTDDDVHGLPVQVELTEAMGAEVYAYFTAAVNAPDLTALSDTQATSATYVARLAAGSETSSNQRISLRPDLSEVHLFDPTSQRSLLAPADEAEVRARQSGAAITIAGGTGRRPVGPVAEPIAENVLQQHGGSVVHVQQPLVAGEPAAVVGTIAGADPMKIASVFDQPVAAALGLDAYEVPMAAGDRPGGSGPYPRPSFAGQVAAGTSLDPSFAAPRAGRQAHAFEGISSASSMPSPPDEPVETPGTASPPVAAGSDHTPARPRGFAPRTIGVAERTAAGADPADSRSIDLPAQHVDEALDRITDTAPFDLDAANVELQAGPPLPASAPAGQARPSFTDTLARIRARQAGTAAPPAASIALTRTPAVRPDQPSTDAPVLPHQPLEVQPPRLVDDTPQSTKN